MNIDELLDVTLQTNLRDLKIIYDSLAQVEEHQVPGSQRLWEALDELLHGRATSLRRIIRSRP